jgi:hypothetical protein
MLFIIIIIIIIIIDKRFEFEKKRTPTLVNEL